MSKLLFYWGLKSLAMSISRQVLWNARLWQPCFPPSQVMLPVISQHLSHAFIVWDSCLASIFFRFWTHSVHLSHGDGPFGVHCLPAEPQDARVRIWCSQSKVSTQSSNASRYFFKMDEAPAFDSCINFSPVVFQPVNLPLVPWVWKSCCMLNPA